MFYSNVYFEVLLAQQALRKKWDSPIRDSCSSVQGSEERPSQQFSEYTIDDAYNGFISPSLASQILTLTVLGRLASLDNSGTSAATDLEATPPLQSTLSSTRRRNTTAQRDRSTARDGPAIGKYCTGMFFFLQKISEVVGLMFLVTGLTCDKELVFRGWKGWSSRVWAIAIRTVLSIWHIEVSDTVWRSPWPVPIQSGGQF